MVDRFQIKYEKKMVAKLDLEEYLGQAAEYHIQINHNVFPFLLSTLILTKKMCGGHI